MYNGLTFANEWSPNEKSFVEIFLYMLPWVGLRNVCRVKTNTAMADLKSKTPLFWGIFL